MEEKEKMEEEERKGIIRAIEETKTVSKSIITAFEKGRISEGEYYYLMVQYQIIAKLEEIENTIGENIAK